MGGLGGVNAKYTLHPFVVGLVAGVCRVHYEWRAGEAEVVEVVSAG